MAYFKRYYWPWLACLLALMDALTHAIESIGSKRSTPWTEALCMHAVQLIGRYARQFVNNPGDPDAADAASLAAALAGAAAAPACVSAAAPALEELRSV